MRSRESAADTLPGDLEIEYRNKKRGIPAGPTERERAFYALSSEITAELLLGKSHGLEEAAIAGGNE